MQKPAKVELRRDAARRAFQEVLAEIGPLSVDMVADAAKGNVAVIKVAADSDARHGIEERIRDKMKAFPIGYVVQWSEHA